MVDRTRPVFTQGLNGRAEHLLAPGDIPVIQTIAAAGDLHGPGQLVLYCLLDIRGWASASKAWSRAIEDAVIELLVGFTISMPTRVPGAPGVYVADAKIAALGLRIRKGCCYHGLSLNVDMDLEPFSRINPCGYRGLEVTQLGNFGVGDDLEEVGNSSRNCSLVNSLKKNQVVQGVKLKGADKVARIPIKVVPSKTGAAQAAVDSRQGA